MSAAIAIPIGNGLAAAELQRAKKSLAYLGDFVLKSRTQALVDAVGSLVGLAEYFIGQSGQDGQMRIFDVLGEGNRELDDVLDSLDAQREKDDRR